MQHLKADGRIETLNALPMTTEKFRTIRLNSYVLTDSLMFLPSSLSSLVEDLKTQKNVSFDILDQLGLYKKDEPEKKKLLLRKGVFPYEYCESISQMRECVSLPPQSVFYSKLTNSNISDEDYVHAQKVWSAFNCQNLIDYMELYCVTDTALLAEVMTEFRLDIMNEFELDCLHYMSTPQLAYDCMLKFTGVSISLMDDLSKILFMEDNIRGGVSYVNQRYAHAGWNGRKFIELVYLDGAYVCFT